MDAVGITKQKIRDTKYSSLKLKLLYSDYVIDIDYLSHKRCLHHPLPSDTVILPSSHNKMRLKKWKPPSRKGCQWQVG